MRSTIRLLATMLIAMAGAGLRPAPASASSPEIVHGQIDETEIGVADFCGLTVDIRSEGAFTTQLADAFQAEIHVVQTITNEANGKVVYTETSNRQRVHAEDNGDGTITFVFTYDGMNARIYTHHGAVLLTVAGFVSLTVTVDEDDNIVGADLVTHGLYDDRDSCEAIVAAIG